MAFERTSYDYLLVVASDRTVVFASLGGLDEGVVSVNGSLVQ